MGYSVMIMQRREDIFGPDAGEFRPERWEGWSPRPWTYVPFNGGPRICLGQQFAYAEMGYTLVRWAASITRSRHFLGVDWGSGEVLTC